MLGAATDITIGAIVWFNFDNPATAPTLCDAPVIHASKDGLSWCSFGGVYTYQTAEETGLGMGVAQLPVPPPYQPYCGGMCAGCYCRGTVGLLGYYHGSITLLSTQWRCSQLLRVSTRPQTGVWTRSQMQHRTRLSRMPI